MRIRIKKGIISFLGTFRVGQEVDLPHDGVALSWIKDGIAESVEEEDPGEGLIAVEEKERPTKIKDGQFWCSKCEAIHRQDSALGQKHVRHRDRKVEDEIRGIR